METKYSTVIMIVPSIAETKNGTTFLKNFNSEELSVIGSPRIEYTLKASSYAEAVIQAKEILNIIERSINGKEKISGETAETPN